MVAEEAVAMAAMVEEAVMEEVPGGPTTREGEYLPARKR